MSRIVACQPAPVEVLQHIAATVDAEALGLRGIVGEPRRGRGQLGAVSRLEGEAAIGLVEHLAGGALEAQQDGLLHSRVLEELRRQDGAEEGLLAKVHEAGVAARQVRGQLRTRHKTGEDDVGEPPRARLGL